MSDDTTTREAVCTHGRENAIVCLLCDDITAEKDLLTALDFARTTGDKIALLKVYAHERTTRERAAATTTERDRIRHAVAGMLGTHEPSLCNSREFWGKYGGDCTCGYETRNAALADVARIIDAEGV